MDVDKERNLTELAAYKDRTSVLVRNSAANAQQDARGGRSQTSYLSRVIIENPRTLFNCFDVTTELYNELYLLYCF